MALGKRAKLFGIGLSRTGTTSLTTALRCVGYRAIHFPKDDMTRAEITNFLRVGKGPLRLSLLNQVHAITDTPVCCTYRALDEFYPGSKFILTVRERQSWLASCRSRWERLPISPAAVPGEAPMMQYIRLTRKHLYGTTDFDESLFSASYNRHVDAVLDYFNTKQQRLLVMDICGGDGWNLLCPFLGVAQPRVAFPHENQRPTSDPAS
jgi:hypothetical protein